MTLRSVPQDVDEDLDQMGDAAVATHESWSASPGVRVSQTTTEVFR